LSGVLIAVRQSLLAEGSGDVGRPQSHLTSVMARLVAEYNTIQYNILIKAAHEIKYTQ
jgi:hypothetical protein